jgi:hypothetical protein
MYSAREGKERRVSKIGRGRVGGGGERTETLRDLGEGGLRAREETVGDEKRTEEQAEAGREGAEGREGQNRQLKTGEEREERTRCVT